MLSERALSLYRIAGNTAERLSVAAFILKYLITWLDPANAAHAETDLSLQGLKFRVGLRGAQTYALKEICLDRVYEKAFDFVPRHGWIVFDVGANVGIFTAQQASRGAHVYAFEPNPNCYERLRKTIANNRLDERVTAFNCAVGSACCTGQLVVSVGMTTQGFVLPSGKPANTNINGPTVSITTLDDVVKSYGVEQIDLLKMDVEGGEVEVLRGATRTLKLVCRVVLEYHSRELLTQVDTLLSDTGFTIILQDDLYPDSSQGILYATRRTGV